MRHTPRLFAVVGSPGSGKDILIRAVNDLGVQHAAVVPKHTSRKRAADDGREMVCSDDKGFNLAGCDLLYRNYTDEYGVMTDSIWTGLRSGVFQVLIVSNIEAISRLRILFRDLMVLVYVHSQMSADEYSLSEKRQGKDEAYIRQRADKYRSAFQSYMVNFGAFDHVLLYAGAPEDLYDQIFRLFRAYETGLLT